MNLNLQSWNGRLTPSVCAFMTAAGFLAWGCTTAKPVFLGEKRPYSVKHVADQVKIQTDACGALRGVISEADRAGIDIVMAVDIRPTKGHYHGAMTEIYMVVDGTISLKLYDPASGQRWCETLGPNELCIIPKGIHHVITAASTPNRLYVISLPKFAGETLSDKL